MMIAFLFLILYVLFSSGQMILNKYYQTRVKLTAPSYMLYLIVMGSVAALLFFLMSGCDTTVERALFVYSGSAASNEAYLSWLNIFMVPMVIAAFFLLMRRRKQTIRQFTANIGMRNYLFVCAGSVVGCVGMVCSMRAMAGMDISIYSPLYSAMYMIFLVCISHFVFHETISRQNMLSVLLGITAVVCTAL